MQKSTRSLVDGGVHTPNHRWEICKALAHIHHLWPSRAVMARINDWLGEGIDQDAEGEYSERSPNYASEVTNRSLVIIARLAGKPGLLGNVRRNLAMTLYRLEANGEVETVQSRRQDQTGIQDVWKYLMHFRELALRDGDRRFAAVAEQILDRVAADPESFATAGYSVGEFLAEALAYPDLTAVLPGPAEPLTEYERFFRGSQLVRIRRDDTTASIFGGTDWHNRRQDSVGHQTSIREIASGLSTNPTFFKLRKGAAILDSVRMSPRFFSTGHFRSDGVTAHRGGWRLHDRVEVPYHLPLPRRVPPGGRRLRARLRGPVLLEDGLPAPAQAVPRAEHDDHRSSRSATAPSTWTSTWTVRATSLTIELCFRSGGSLTGVVPATGDGNFQLVDGEGSYTFGGDTITFGPGNGSGIRQPIAMDPGEKYTYLGGSLVPPGQRVYITGEVPFRYTLRLR